MNKSILILILLLISINLKSQINSDELKIIAIEGFSRQLIYPELFKVQFYLQEETRRNREGKIVQDTLERIEETLISELTKLGYKGNELKLQSYKSETTIYGEDRRIKEGKIYELELRNKEKVLELFENLRFEGLKGIEIINYYPELREIEEKLYELAIEDAKEKANKILEKMNYKIKDITFIEIELEPKNWLRTYPFNNSIYYNSNNPKFVFNNQPSLLKCIMKVKFSYE